MGFLAVCTALYDYSPRTDGELAIHEGDLVYILEKSSEDDWWRGKKRAVDGEEEEPTGLVPSNYVEEARPTHDARALFEYSRQTDEEISFAEDASLSVFDTSDPDWTLVGLNGEYGFAPANYIELLDNKEGGPQFDDVASPALPARPSQSERSEDELPLDPATSLASITGQQATSRPQPPQTFTPEASEDEEPGPSLPLRPVSQETSSIAATSSSPRTPVTPGIIASPPLNRAVRDQDEGVPASPGGYHLYNVNEMVSVMGKQKKMPTTLGINLATGVILIIPEKKRDGPQQEWTAEKLMHYSIEGKHVFMELVKPSKSIDFHAGAKDTAAEIVASLGELAGAVRAEGLREVIAAGRGGRNQGRMLYDFMAQGEDEVTVADGDEVIIIDDAQSEEWWKIRRIKNGKEGVVPSSYVEVVKTAPLAILNPDQALIESGRSTVDQNRLEEQRLAYASVNESNKAAKRQEDQDLARSREVGPGLKLPHRASSLIVGQNEDNAMPQKNKRDSRIDGRSQSHKSKPDPSKTRTWTDRSGSFKVDAQFIGLKDGKIHLHKINGVKIAVPVVKMATEDLEYVERVTGRSLDEDKPLSDLVKRTSRAPGGKAPSPAPPASAQPPSKPEYDWFDFFLKCGVSPYQCERYSYNFNKDSMDESVLPDITPAVLRNLGLKEGDVLRIMKYLDNKYGRGAGKQKSRNVSFGGEEVIGNDEATESTPSPGGLFSGPGGKLKNNTRKGRPAPTVQTNDTVDAKALLQIATGDEPRPPPKDYTVSPQSEAPPPPKKDNEIFDDDAWDVKPQKISHGAPSTTAAQPPVPTNSPPPLTGSMADLSLLSQPLQPIVTHATGTSTTLQSQRVAQDTASQSIPSTLGQQQPLQDKQTQPIALNAQAQGATPQFFSQLSAQAGGLPQQAGSSMMQNPPYFNPQMTGQYQANPGARQRPQAPPVLQQNGLMPPPPSRPLSAPQNATTQSNFGLPPIQPQLTGMPQSTQSPPPTLAMNNGMQAQQPGPQPQMFTGYQSSDQSSNQFHSFINQNPSFSQPQQLQPQLTAMPTATLAMNSQPNSGPFGTTQLRSQPTSYHQGFGGLGNNGGNGPPIGSANSGLPAPLQPQQTAVMHQLSQPFLTQSPPPIPPLPQQPTVAPLKPQKTGPAPPVQFGVAPGVKPLVAQPTGRRANLAQATPDNPFGF